MSIDQLILQDRATMMAKARQFFAFRNIMEVDCPALVMAPSVDAYIDLIPVGDRYLFSSAEYAMKRLLADGAGDIYQLSHVFRNDECGAEHTPEFMMAEWYRHNIALKEMSAETIEFIAIFLGEHPTTTITYHDLFLSIASVDITTATDDDLLAALGPYSYPSIKDEGRDAILNAIIGTTIIPQLPPSRYTVITDYPASQAALARTKTTNGTAVAERFEVIFGGTELANGYHELDDPHEQHQRLLHANTLRTHPLPIDERLLKALEKGLPDCCGVAVGFDRLMKLRHNTTHINNILPFPYHCA